MKQEKRFKQIFFTITLCIALLLSVMPLSTTAVASSDCPNHTSWTAIAAAEANNKVGGNYYLTKNITNNHTAWPAVTLISNTSNLCLNGKTLDTLTPSPALVLKGITANIYDCNGSGTIKSSNTYGYALRLNNAQANLCGIKVLGSSYYPAIWVYGSSSANLYGCTVVGSVATYGGSVRIENSTITGNGGRYAAVESSGNRKLNLTVGGKTIISGPSGGVRLRDDEIITVDGLTNGAEIHVTSVSDADLIPVTGPNTTDVSALFHSSKDHYKIINGENNVVYLAVNHEYSEATCVTPPTCSCGKTEGSINADNHNISSEWATEEGTHYHTCLNGCGKTFNEEACSGGTDTCTAAAVCTTCNVIYGSVLGHDLAYIVDTVDSSKLAETCSRCDHSASAYLTIETSICIYNGQAFTPASITYEENWLGTDKPTNITYEENINAGVASAKIIIEAQELTKTFTIEPKALTADMATVSPASGTYLGSDHTKPTVTLTYNGKVLDKDTDYTTESWIGDFTTAGDKTITLHGKGNFSESITLTYNIAKATTTEELFKVVLPKNAVYDGTTAYKAEVAVADHVAGIGTFTIHYNGSENAPTDAGEYTVTMDVAEGENYTAATGIELGKFSIAKAIPNIGTITVNKPEDALDISQVSISRSDETIPGVLSIDPNQNFVQGYNIIAYTFTPDDLANYNVLRGRITVTAADTTAPVITGVDNGAYYCTEQAVTVTDNNLSTVTLNGHTVGDSFVLKDDQETAYTIVATDKAGNISTVTVKMIPIEDISDNIQNYDSTNVTSDDKSELQVIVNNITELLKDEDLTDEEKETLENNQRDAEALIQVIDDTAAEMTGVIDKAASYEDETLESKDKKDLIQLSEEIKELLDTQNLTPEERTELKTLQEQVDRMIDTLNNAEENPTDKPEDAPEDTPEDENPEVVTYTWERDSKGWYYLGSDGSVATSSWVRDSKGWCFVGADGYCETNCWKQNSDGWMYFDDEGSMTKNTWIGSYYLGTDGYMVTNGWVYDGIGWCYVDNSGVALRSRWISVGGYWYYLSSDGYRINNCWWKDSTGWCYFDTNGVLLTNCWKQDSKGWCYIGADGYCETNCWKLDGDRWMYLDEEGSMTKREWILDNDYWYYLGADGYMVTGEQEINGTWYIFEDSGIWIE